MTWYTTEVEYEGFPLLLRRPGHESIRRYKKKLTQLVTIEHLLDKVAKNGLPEKKYNKSLADFDHYMCSLFDEQDTGRIFLIETFAGKRNYYYYTLPDYDIKKQIKKVKVSFKVRLTLTKRDDTGWEFLKAYPFDLRNP